MPSRLGDVEGLTTAGMVEIVFLDDLETFSIKQHGIDNVIQICILGMEKLSQKFIFQIFSKRFAAKKEIATSFKLTEEPAKAGHVFFA